MADEDAKRLADRDRIFTELQQLTIDEYKIKSRMLQESKGADAPGEGGEFGRLRRQLAAEKDLKKVVRELFVLQESSAHAMAYLVAKNNERIIELLRKT